MLSADTWRQLPRAWQKKTGVPLCEPNIYHIHNYIHTYIIHISCMHACIHTYIQTYRPTYIHDVDSMNQTSGFFLSRFFFPVSNIELGPPLTAARDSFAAQQSELLFCSSQFHRADCIRHLFASEGCRAIG